MNINKMLNFKIPFLFSFFVAAIIVFSDIVLLKMVLNESDVLGASTKSRSEKVQKSKSGVGLNKTDVNNHVSKVKNATLEIKKVAKIEKEVGNTKVGEEIEKSADEISYSSVENINPLDEVDNRPAWKSFLLGPDYKNLGEIRSNLVQTRNQIRKIEKTMEKNMGEEEANTLRVRLGDLETERLKIVNYIEEKDDGFSLFGWLAKLISGYNKNIEEEEDLDQEIDVVEDTKTEDELEELNENLDENEDNEENEETSDNDIDEEAEENENVEESEETEEADATE